MKVKRSRILLNEAQTQTIQVLENLRLLKALLDEDYPMAPRLAERSLLKQVDTQLTHLRRTFRALKACIIEE